MLTRLRASERLADHVAALTRHHLRLGFLVHEMPLSRQDDLPLPADLRAGPGRRHAAQRRRPPGHPRTGLRGGDRAPPGAGSASCWRRRWPGGGIRRGRRCAATSWPGRSGSAARPGARAVARRARGGSVRRRDHGPRGGDRVRARPAAQPPGGGTIGCRAVSDPDCIFCKIIAGELPGQIVDQDERTVAFMDISPATRGHALVVPAATPATCWRSSPMSSPRSMAAAQRLAQRVARAAGRRRRQPAQLVRRRRPGRPCSTSTST